MAPFVRALPYAAVECLLTLLKQALRQVLTKVSESLAKKRCPGLLDIFQDCNIISLHVLTVVACGGSRTVKTGLQMGLGGRTR